MFYIDQVTEICYGISYRKVQFLRENATKPNSILFLFKKIMFAVLSESSTTSEFISDFS